MQDVRQLFVLGQRINHAGCPLRSPQSPEAEVKFTSHTITIWQKKPAYKTLAYLMHGAPRAVYMRHSSLHVNYRVSADPRSMTIRF